MTPPPKICTETFMKSTGDKEMSTTMALPGKNVGIRSLKR